MPRVLPRLKRSEPTAPSAEAYRILRSNLSIALLDLDRSSVLVTSAKAGEGKTSTTVNLARALAVAGHRVVLVDLDLRHPDAHNWLGVQNDLGATDVLTRRHTLGECLQFVPTDETTDGTRGGLYFLPTGNLVSNPAELISSPLTPALLDALTSQADVVLVDAPPVLPVADTLAVGRMVGGAVLVVETRKTPLSAVQQAKDALTRSQTRLLGVVVNKLHPKDARSDPGYGYGVDYPYATGSRHDRSSERSVAMPDAAPSTRRFSQPASTDEHDLGNSLSPEGGIDLPWPNAAESKVVAGVLPPAPSMRVGLSPEQDDQDPASLGGDADADIRGNGLFDGNGLVDASTSKRWFGRRR